MKKALLATLACTSLLGGLSSVSAAVVDFTYTGTAGSGISGSGTLTTGAIDPSDSFFTPSVQITGITGTFDGAPITGLSDPGTFYKTSGLFGDPGNDNILYIPVSQSFMSQPTYVDRYGLSFSTSTDEINLYLGLGGYGEIDSVTATGAVTSDIGGTFTLTQGSVPEPSSWLLLLVGFGLTGLLARNTANRTTKSAATIGLDNEVLFQPKDHCQ